MTVSRKGRRQAAGVAAILKAGALFAMAVLGSHTAAAGYDAEFAAVIANPNDPVLNLEFARSAEARGELRHALAALERARAARPGDAAISAEYERVRAKLLPSATAVVVQGGVSYATNPRQIAADAPRHRDSAVMDTAVSVADERTVGSLRLRSFAMAAAQWSPNTSELSSGRISAESGPVFRLSDTSWVHVAPGVSFVWLNDTALYTEASAAVTLGTIWGGLTQQITARYGYRDGGDPALGYSGAQVVEVLAQLVARPNLMRGDYLYVQPRFRYAEPDDSQPANVFLNTAAIGPALVARDLAPPDFAEWGGRVAYFMPIMQGKIFVGAGIAAYDRPFGSFVLDPAALAAGVPVATTDRRHDVYIEPTAHIILPNAFMPNVDVRFDYRFENNFSNDPSREYDNHVAGMRVIGRY